MGPCSSKDRNTANRDRPSNFPEGKPTLVYWDVHGRASICQALLAAGDVDYDLDTETANNYQAASKDVLPFGQVPALKHGDVVIAQTGAINRYAARLAGLYPVGDIVEASKCDMILDEVYEIFGGLFKGNGQPTPEAKTAGWKTIREEFLPKHYQMLEDILSKSGKPYFGGNAPGAGDVAFVAVWSIYNRAGVGEVVDGYKCLKASFDGTIAKYSVLENFQPGGQYFSSDPENPCF